MKGNAFNESTVPAVVFFPRIKELSTLKCIHNCIHSIYTHTDTSSGSEPEAAISGSIINQPHGHKVKGQLMTRYRESPVNYAQIFAHYALEHCSESNPIMLLILPIMPYFFKQISQYLPFSTQMRLNRSS